MFTSILARLAVPLLAIALTASAFLIWPGWLHQAREAGARSERLVWQEMQRRAEIEREEERRVAQAKIDAAETAMINTMAEGAIRLAELEQALKERTDDENDTALVCPAMPDGVRNALKRIGGGYQGAGRPRQ